jgi:hypothetical protein
MEFVFIYFALAVIVGVAANTRGRSGIGWFLLAILISPLISGLLVLALPRIERSSPSVPVELQQTHSFEPGGILKGVPYRQRENGSVEAMMTGGLVRFRDMEQFRAATEGRDAIQTTPLLPPTTTYRGYTYFAREDGVDLKLKHHGEMRHFRNEQEVVAYIDAITGGTRR